MDRLKLLFCHMCCRQTFHTLVNHRPRCMRPGYFTYTAVCRCCGEPRAYVKKDPNYKDPDYS